MWGVKVVERRSEPFQSDRAKFQMQISVTWYLFAVCFALFAALVWLGTVDDVKSLIEKMMTFFGLVVAYWIGTSKGAADNRDQLNKMLPPVAPPATTGSTTSTTSTTTETK